MGRIAGGGDSYGMDRQSSPCAAAEQTRQENGAREYLVGVGDVLEVSVWNEPEVSKTVFVRLDGKISLPLIGDVLAQGASPESPLPTDQRQDEQVLHRSQCHRDR